MKTAVVLFIAIFSQAVGNVFLSRGMKEAAAAKTGTFTGHFLQMAESALHSPSIWLGTLLLIVFFLLFAAALSWSDLSFVLPATAFGYPLNVAFAHIFLGEPVHSLRWAGTLLISLGVILVSRTARGGGAPEESASLTTGLTIAIDESPQEQLDKPETAVISHTREP